MTLEQSSNVPFKNGQKIKLSSWYKVSPSIFQRNSCDRSCQDAAFDLEKYGPYIDKIRALFVPSLEYRIRSLLREFVYSADSRSAERFPRFKRFVDAIATWKDPLDKVVEYDVSTMGEVIGSIANCALKDDLISCLLDSTVLHHRLSKICRELDALGIDDNILRSLNVWNSMNERFYRASHDRFMYVSRSFPHEI
ncbi:uncharacterized protein LOC112589669 [Harpegnathos saltator]|uniref:uncharacterized protein LOC112589669 n=1 Tax=Harpegnathos saltator TaxID=610380 RepID=UPI000DBED7D2|nr:uncharacterized protein LOC112589669 [Harpegnathos saltator]